MKRQESGRVERTPPCHGLPLSSFGTLIPVRASLNDQPASHATREAGTVTPTSSNGVIQSSPPYCLQRVSARRAI